MGHFIESALPIIAAIATTAAGFPALAPVAAGLTSGVENYASNGHNLGKALEGGALSGGGTYLGQQVGGNLFGPGPEVGGTAGGALTGAGAISGSGAIGGLSGDSLGAAGSGLTDEFASGFSGAPTFGTGSLVGPASTGVGSAAGSSGGASILSSLPNMNLGTIGSNLNSLTGPTVGNSISSALGPSLSNTGVGAAAGGVLGSQAASGLIDQSPPGPPGWKPSQSSASPLPPSLSMLSTLTPGQQASNIATQGTYGGGNGPQEESYYTNLLNRQLVDPSGNVSPLSSLSPIENTYDQQLGLGGFTNPTDLLKALRTWSPS